MSAPPLRPEDGGTRERVAVPDASAARTPSNFVGPASPGTSGLASATPTSLLWGGHGRREKRPPVAHDDPALQHLGRVLENRYALTGVMGRGGMGVVYEAFDQLLQRLVVVKVIAPKVTDARAPERLMREARLACRVQHPAIVTVFHLGLFDGEPFMVMERLEGVDLDAILSTEGALDLETVVAIADPVAEALDELHAAGVVHRDVKPGNVFLLGGRTDRPRPKLIDFGLSILDGQTSARLTRVGHVIGTPEYIAPECARGAAATSASDVYALATSIFELLVGELPFEGVGIDLMIAKTRRAPRRLSDLTSEPWALAVDEALQRALTPDPTLRPTAGGLLADLRRIASPVPLTRRIDRPRSTVPPTRTLPAVDPRDVDTVEMLEERPSRAPTSSRERGRFILKP